MTKRVDSLIDDLCGSSSHPLAPALRGWAQTSRPFLAFAETHAPKIRKKVRLAVSEGERGDLLAELAVAALLLRAPRLTVRYEAGRADGGRSPDFEVTFGAQAALHVEVTRLRQFGSAGGDPGGEVRRLARVLGDKIGQFPAGAANLLAVVVPPGALEVALVPAALRLLGGGPTAGVSPEAARAFHRGRPRLSAVALCAFGPAGEPLGLELWSHPGAKHPLPPEVVRALLRAGAAGD